MKFYPFICNKYTKKMKRISSMKLIYISHSGFAIEGKDFAILIDFYRDSPEEFVHRQLLSHPGQLYILSSHSHPDHFNPEVLKWQKQRPDIRYILAEEIRQSLPQPFPEAVFLRAGERWQDQRLLVKAFGSTDIGISFLIQIDGKNIFHAGDLNNWHWAEESTPEEIKAAERNYLQELDSIAGETEEIDLALFPVDPRLGNDYTRGARQFIDRIHPRQFAPMHFWRRYDQANAFREYAEKHGCQFIAITREGEIFEHII